jgi:hypothetical protein
MDVYPSTKDTNKMNSEKRKTIQSRQCVTESYNNIGQKSNSTKSQTCSINSVNSLPQPIETWTHLSADEQIRIAIIIHPQNEVEVI